MFRSSIQMDFRTGSARSDPNSPEIIFFAKTDYTLRRNSDLPVPNLESLIVVQIDGDPQRGPIKTQNLGDKLPGPSDRFFFEVIAEREIAQHLKKRAVTIGLTHVVYVCRPQAVLARRDSRARRLFLTDEIRFERYHSGDCHSNVGSFAGTNEALGSRKWPFSSKNSKYAVRSWSTVIACTSTPPKKSEPGSIPNKRYNQYDTRAQANSSIQLRSSIFRHRLPLRPRTGQ